MSYVDIFLRYIFSIRAQTTNNRWRIFINKEADPQDVHSSSGSELVSNVFIRSLKGINQPILEQISRNCYGNFKNTGICALAKCFDLFTASEKVKLPVY